MGPYVVQLLDQASGVLERDDRFDCPVMFNPTSAHFFGN